MPVLKLRIALNKAENSVSVHKLANSLEGAAAFLDNLIRELGLEHKEDWRAVHFSQSAKKYSIAYNIVSKKNHNKKVVDSFNSAIAEINEADKDLHVISKYSKDTISSFAKLARGFGEEDKLKMGLFVKNQQSPSVWATVTHEKYKLIEDVLHRNVTYYGGIQGVIKAVEKGVRRHKCKIIENINDSVVKCSFDDSLYSEVMSLFARKHIIIRAGGMLYMDEENRIKHLVIEKIESCPEYTEGDIQRLRGCWAGMTAGLSTSEFLRKIDDEIW